MSTDQPAPAPAAIVAHYEELRDQALAGTAGPRRGLALLLGEGMVAWMRAWSRCIEAPPRVATATTPAEGRGELVQLLADIALSRLEGVGG